MRAGFGVGVAIKVLKNWQVDDELLTALAGRSGIENTGEGLRLPHLL